MMLLPGWPTGACCKAGWMTWYGPRSRTTRSPCSYIDLDHFKQVNDTFRHGLGDSVLQDAASRMRAHIRQTDHVARLGGDEFAILVSGRAVRQRATELAERLVAELSAPYLCQGQTVSISASIGVTLVTNIFQNHPRMDEVLKNADFGLYRAKSEGRRRFHVFAA